MKKIVNIKASKFFQTGALVAALFIGQSCNVSVLDEEVVSGIGNNYLNTTTGFNDGVNAVYSSLREWYGTERGNNFTIFGTDSYQNGADGSHKFINTYDGGFDARSAHAREVWDLLYVGINAANAVVERAPAVPNISEALRKQRVAEVKVIRAHHYFLLTQLYGGVDLRLTETVAPTKVATRASIQEMYAAIISDLESALPDLENRARSADYGRFTRASAEHLLARVYLTKATSEAKASDDFAKAATFASNVINNYGIKLVDDFADVHRQGNEKNEEVVFAVQYTNSPLTNGGGNNAHVFFLMEYDVLPGMQRDTENGRPFKRYMPTKYTLNEVFVNRDIDSRYYKTFKDVYYSNKPGTFNTSFDKSKPTVTFAQGDTTIFDPGYEMSEAERAKRPYQVMTPSMYTERIFPALRKHIDGGRADRTQFEGVRDYIAFRLAETYLILAEAQFKQGKTAEAVEAINVIRRRAGWPGKKAEMEITASDLTMEFLMAERERELLGEQMRWFDLKRWGNLVERVKKYNPQAAPNIKDFHVLRPIPQNQIDRVEGNQTAFPQNPGY
ncbi:RagB/SusD family nutrient uptake outer membrane protein [Arundinibacter roseus]|uniref:RagB/SusD family nutrient uptake outer membrane protein n=1 Tax=Arundinibacter roseus TaxID=2070510 RepID=A0A4R4KBQ1_9BACT|nr:RagB/SusD family nutrient uptake outer membrane protein [Arundinibacter roseus]TDB65324.1 RagB/SusD family nutrient uptake outer membrane protein [Arundinibacter roseus]